MLLRNIFQRRSIADIDRRLDKNCSEPCSVCGGTSHLAFSKRILGRHVARYFFCPACEYLRTEKPYWLNEAYSSAISRADTGIVFRNLQISRALIGILGNFFAKNDQFLDSAGGTGLLTRMMRDAGFDYYWEDHYCANALACGYEAKQDQKFAAVSAFEALEHMIDPVAFIKQSMERSVSGTFIFTTELFEGFPPQDWWYYAFQTGQHISFFSSITLQHIAERLDATFLSAKGMHMMTRLPIGQRQYANVVRRYRKVPYETQRSRGLSFTEADHQAMLAFSSNMANVDIDTIK